MALEGSLQDMSLTDLFQVFHMGPKSGTLLLSGGSQRGVIYVSKGRLIDAAVVCGPEREVIATGETAILGLLQWEDGRFVFRGDVDVSRRPVRIVRDSETLVLEAMRQRAQQPTSSYQHIDPDTQLELSPSSSNTAGGLRLDLDQWRLLSQVSVSSNIRELCKHTGMPVDQVVELVHQLAAIGLLQIVQPSRRTQSTSHTYQPRVSSQVEITTSPPPAPSSVADKSLLNAIMRRIRSL